MLPFLCSFVRMKSGRRMRLCPWRLLLWGVLAGFCASCGGGLKGLLTPASSGRPYELLVVAEPKVWEHPAGRAWFEALDTDVPGLPQPERVFRLMHAAPQDLDATLRLTRNMLVLDVDGEKYPQAEFTYARDVFAAPQLVVTLRVPDEDSLKAAAGRYAASLVRLFTQEERRRRMDWLADHHNAEVERKVAEQFGCRVWVPTELASCKAGENFFWAGTNRATDDLNFVVYAYPYTGAEALTKAEFIHRRDSVMKENIPGARAGMYMATDSLMTDVRLFSLDGDTVCEARGLWQVKGDFMGGPFVSHARVDKACGLVVVGEVFVYAPGRMKRNLIRSMEASLYTLRLPQDMEIEGTKNTTLINK